MSTVLQSASSRDASFTAEAPSSRRPLGVQALERSERLHRRFERVTARAARIVAEREDREHGVADELEAASIELAATALEGAGEDAARGIAPATQVERARVA